MECSLKTASRLCAKSYNVIPEDSSTTGVSSCFFLRSVSCYSDSQTISRVAPFLLSKHVRRRRKAHDSLISKFIAVCPSHRQKHAGTKLHSFNQFKDRNRNFVNTRFKTPDRTRRDTVHTVIIGCHRPAFPRQSVSVKPPTVRASDNSIVLNGVVGDFWADLTSEKPSVLQRSCAPSGKLLNVAVDVDEVLGSFLATLNIFIAERYSLHHKLCEYHVYDFMHIWNCSQLEANQRVHAFFESQHFKDGISPIPGAYQSLLQLAEYCNLIVVTSRQHIIKKPTVDWIERHFPGIFKDVHFGNHFALHGAARPKSEICRSLGVDILIDDNPRYAVECAEHGIEALLFDFKESYPWSKILEGPTHPLITRVTDWEEVEGVVEARSQTKVLFNEKLSHFDP